MNEWVADYLDNADLPDEEAIAWLRSRPDSVKKTARQFPPACVVEVIEHTCCGKTGRAIVVSYLEDDTLTVMFGPDDSHRHRVHIENLELVQCRPTVTREWVDQILAG